MPEPLPSSIGQGVGGALFAHALGQAARLGARVIEIEADPHAVGFYEHMGGRYVRDSVGDMGSTLPILTIELGAQR